MRSALSIFAKKPVAVLLAILVLAGVSFPREICAQTKEYQVKAAFIYNFAQFVDWPASAFETNAPFRIGVLGENPFGGALEAIVKGEAVHGRRLVITQADHVSALKDCQIIFVSKSEHNRIDEILSDLRGRSVLTIGEAENFSRRGGIINFYLEAGKVRFEINLRAAKEHGLVVSSQLLGVGKIIGDDGSPMAK